jgi:hypothetical protein
MFMIYYKFNIFIIKKYLRLNISLICLNRENLEKIYFTYIRPLLEYACELWDGCTILDLNKIEQAFELTDASAERSSNGCTIKLNQAPVAEYLQSNIALLSSMI